LKTRAGAGTRPRRSAASWREVTPRVRRPRDGLWTRCSRRGRSAELSL
jgi:hypothetical protein